MSLSRSQKIVEFLNYYCFTLLHEIMKKLKIYKLKYISNILPRGSNYFAFFICRCISSNAIDISKFHVRQIWAVLEFPNIAYVDIRIDTDIDINVEL